METRRLLLAAVLSLAVLIVWQIVFPPPEPTPPPPEPTSGAAAEPAAEPAPPPQREPAPAAEGDLFSTPGERQDPLRSAEGLAGSLAEPVASESEERVVVELDTYRAELTNRGAQLLAFELDRHESARGTAVNLVRERREAAYPFALAGADGSASGLNEALFAVERRRLEGDAVEVMFRYRGAAGAAAKRFVFRPQGRFEVDVSLPGEEGGWGVMLGPGIRNPSEEELANRFSSRSVVYRLGEDVETVGAPGLDAARTVPGAGLRWIGLEDTYFLSVLIPHSPVDSAVVRPVVVEPAEEGGYRFRGLPPEEERSDAVDDLPREAVVVIRAVGERLEMGAYWGAKQYDRLAEVGVGLEETVERGRFIGVLVGPLSWSLQWLYDNVVGNYGWAIILMTVLIKVLLFPLTFKSMVSMQKMQEVNPKIQAIRQKYRPKLKDKSGKPNVEAQSKMNEEIMALYKKEGVNPAGGCLPMLLQIPILFAFYRLLYTSVELRHAPWVGWIQDLTAYDPYFVLPIVMGGTQFLQQRLTPASGDPMQRRIFLLMPVVFTVLFLKFPSGLVLYWLTNNALTIGQQLIYNRVRAQPEEEGASSGGSRRASKKKAEK